MNGQNTDQVRQNISPSLPVLRFSQHLCISQSAVKEQGHFAVEHYMYVVQCIGVVLMLKVKAASYLYPYVVWIFVTLLHVYKEVLFYNHLKNL